MTSESKADPAGRLTKSEQIQILAQRLAETEAALQALTAGQVDAVVDPASGLPILLREAQEKLRLAHDELEDRVRARTADLEKANRLLLALIDTMPVGALIADADGNLLQTNAAGEAILGETVRGTVESPQRSYSLCYPDGAPIPPHEFPLRHALKEGRVVRDFEAVVRHPNGEERAILIGAAPVLSESGRIISAVAIFQDITEHKEAQHALEGYADHLEETVARRTAALRASEARFRTIFEDSVFGIALLDAEGRIVASNPALRTMLGYGQEQLEGTLLTEYTHPDAVEADTDLHQELVLGELDYYQVDRRYIRSDGQVRWGEFTLSRVAKTGADKHWLAIAMLEDITEKRMNQEALLHTERLAIAGRLGASLAHEINNPLQSVIGCLGLAEEILEDGAEVRRYLEIAMEELERAAGIVTQLRDLSRETKTKKKEPADLNAFVEKTLMLTRKRCQNRGVEVEWQPAASLPAVPMVPDRMQQVCLNLVLNAVDAMPRGGQLRVSTAATGQPPGVHIRFADTGVGIAPDTLSRIFEPFHSTRNEGLGLGLYISKKVVDEHDGRIEVDSQVGEGTTFTVWLPV